MNDFIELADIRNEKLPKKWRPQGGSNPCSRRERAMS